MKPPKKIFIDKFWSNAYEEKDIELTEYVLAGSERKAVVRRLNEFLLLKANYACTKAGMYIKVADVHAELKKIKEGK